MRLHEDFGNIAVTGFSFFANFRRIFSIFFKVSIDLFHFNGNVFCYSYQINSNLFRK